MARSSGGLTRWFKENWVDVKTGKPCGRSKGEKRGYPACRPSKRISSKTPKTVGEMTAAEKARFKREPRKWLRGARNVLSETRDISGFRTGLP